MDTNLRQSITHSVIERTKDATDMNIVDLKGFGGMTTAMKYAHLVPGCC